MTSAAGRFPDNPVVFYMLAMSYEGSGALMPAIVAARKSVDLFKVKNDVDGEKRATILLGVLVQKAKAIEESRIATEAARSAQPSSQPPAAQ
jgi:hypothetical protein